MKSLVTLVEDIITELTELQQSGAKRPLGEDDTPIPRMLPAGNGRSIIITKEIENTIRHIAQQMMDNDPELKSSYNVSEWLNFIRNCLGQAIAPIDLDDDAAENAQTVLNNVKAAVSEKDRRISSCVHYFGCTLFGGDPISPFTIGPVCIEHRDDWLERLRAEGNIGAIIYRRIKRIWSGETLGKRKHSHDSAIEYEILDALGSCPYVISIKLTGLAREAGKEKALTAARLALTMIALLAPAPSRALNGLNLAYDGYMYNQKSLVRMPGGQISSGSKWSHDIHGPWLKAGEWDYIFSANSEHFKIAGEILEYIISPAPEKLKRPKLMNVLAQALLWFHEGCRERVTLMAVVNLAASMDALSVAGKSKGICQLITTRLGLKDDSPVHKDGEAMKTIIERIYNYGRSRTIHGTNEKFGYDWTTTRGYAEQFAMHCLLQCMGWAYDNPRIDDPTLMRTGKRSGA